MMIRGLKGGRRGAKRGRRGEREKDGREKEEERRRRRCNAVWMQLLLLCSARVDDVVAVASRRLTQREQQQSRGERGSVNLPEPGAREMERQEAKGEGKRERERKRLACDSQREARDDRRRNHDSELSPFFAHLLPFTHLIHCHLLAPSFESFVLHQRLSLSCRQGLDCID